MKQWTKDLKFAIIEEDMEKIIALSEDIPQTTDIELAKEACILIEQAVKLATEKKNILRSEMSKLKNARKYFS